MLDGFILLKNSYIDFNHQDLNPQLFSYDGLLQRKAIDFFSSGELLKLVKGQKGLLIMSVPEIHIFSKVPDKIIAKC